MLFETAWTTKGVTYTRQFDTTKNKSIKQKTHFKSEYFLESPSGEFKGFLDGVPLKKVEGSAYGVNNAYGEKAAKYVAIRDLGNKYNIDPRTWFLDIETSVASFVYGNPNEEIQIRKKGENV